MSSAEWRSAGLKRSSRGEDASFRTPLRRCEFLSGRKIDDGCGDRRGLLSRAVVAFRVIFAKTTAEIVLDSMHGVAGDE